VGKLSLYASALYFSDEETGILLITTDLIGFKGLTKLKQLDITLGLMR
jgi:hypothetical protein